jgi:hypothetical protein
MGLSREQYDNAQASIGTPTTLSPAEFAVLPQTVHSFYEHIASHRERFNPLAFEQSLCRVFAYLSLAFHQSVQAVMLGYSLFLEVSQSVDMFHSPEVAATRYRDDRTRPCLFLPMQPGQATAPRDDGKKCDNEKVKATKVRYECPRCPEFSHIVKLRVAFALKIAIGAVSFKEYAQYVLSNVVRQSMKPSLHDPTNAEVFDFGTVTGYSHLCHNKGCNTPSHSLVESTK